MLLRLLFCFSAVLVPTKGGPLRRGLLGPLLEDEDTALNDESISTQALQFMTTFLQGHSWIPASQIANSSRSPCPLLNTLANHGFLPRNGRQLKISDFENGITQAINFSPSFASNLTTGAFQRLGLLTGDATKDSNVAIDLVSLDAHDKTEHDASLTRLDIIQGNNLVVQPEYVRSMLNDTIPATYPSLNTSSLGRTRVRREAESIEAGSPPLVNNDVMFDLSLAEAGLFLLFLGQGDEDAQTPDARSVPKGQAQEWFDFERFPLGWMRSKRVLEFDADLLPLVERVTYWRSYWLEQES